MSLTPYDTGKRLEPQLWPIAGTLEVDSPDVYGRVDFENEESASELTVYVERADDGALVVHILSEGMSEVRVNLVED